MSETKWTPGPWEWQRGHSDWGLSRSNAVYPEGKEPDNFENWVAEIHAITPYCIGASPREKANSATADANARLIAAAPDLYEACDDAREWLLGDKAGADAPQELVNALSAKLRAALAKARGE